METMKQRLNPLASAIITTLALTATAQAQDQESSVLEEVMVTGFRASLNDYLTNAVRLILEAQNLTNERNTLYIDSERQDPLFETEIGRIFTAGVSVKF